MTLLKPLAERMRPTSLEGYFGQRHLVGPEGVLRRMIEQQRLPSLIFWGPPGVGKTTLAEIIARSLDTSFHSLSAVHSGVKEVREVLERIAGEQAGLFGRSIRPILFIDEIHRFSKSQQDSLLGAVEQGLVTLIGATTENPSFEVIRPLLSRCQVYTLEPLGAEELLGLLEHALTTDEQLRTRHIELRETAALLHLSGGDARRALNILELVTLSSTADPLVVTDALVSSLVQTNPLAFDKGGELHYDIASALIKSIRGSDPDAAIYWLARLIEGGEDPSFIARRLMISAAADIGLANPNALLLAETVIYLACSEKSNSAYLAIDRALALVRQTGNQPVPLHLRNASTALMKDLGYGSNYRYPHNAPGHFVEQQYLPEALRGQVLWEPQPHSAAEQQLDERQRKRWRR